MLILIQNDEILLYFEDSIDACLDKDKGAKDQLKNTCEWYNTHPDACELLDVYGSGSGDGESSFEANEMCCGCKKAAINSK